MPLLLFTGMYMLNGQVDILLLGLIKGAREAGIYQVASRIAGLIGFFLLAAMPALAPEISSLYAARRMDRLQQVITRAVRLTLLASLPVGLALIIFGRWLLAHLFGADFAQGKNTLAILSVEPTRERRHGFRLLHASHDGPRNRYGQRHGGWSGGEHSVERCADSAMGPGGRCGCLRHQHDPVERLALRAGI